MKITEIFNWLGQRPVKNYTLREYFAERNGQVIDDNRLNFTRAGRGVERLVTGTGALGAAMIAMGGIFAGNPGMIVMAPVVLGLYKVSGVALGKMTDMAVRHNTPRV